MVSPILPSTELDPLRAAGVLSRLMRVLEHRLALCGHDDGLSVTEIGVLAEIGRGTALPSAIARLRYTDPARVSRIVDRLVSLGLVTRTVGERDRRQLQLSLSPAGEERLELGRADVRSAMAGLLDGLDDHEREALAIAVQGVQRVLMSD